jgi:hypothetical protein
LQDFGKRGKILIDLDDNRYLVPDVETLPQRERDLFQRYVYWSAFSVDAGGSPAAAIQASRLFL